MDNNKCFLVLDHFADRYLSHMSARTGNKLRVNVCTKFQRWRPSDNNVGRTRARDVVFNLKRNISKPCKSRTTHANRFWEKHTVLLQPPRGSSFFILELLCWFFSYAVMHSLPYISRWIASVIYMSADNSKPIYFSLNFHRHNTICTIYIIQYVTSTKIHTHKHKHFPHAN